MSGSDADRVPWSEILVPPYLLPLALVCLGVWLHAADSLLVATMMPAIVAEIGGAPLISWTFALYELGSIVAGAASGLMALRHGVKHPMTCAALVFAAGCALSAAAPEMWVMLAGRLLQGLGGGGLISLSFVAVTQLFPNRLTARVMAAISTLWGTSAFFGPLIGGLFVELGSWRGGFWFFAAQAVLLAAWTGFGAPAVTRTAVRDGGAGLPGLRLACLSAAVILIAASGIAIEPTRTGAFIVLGLGCLAAFLFLESRAGAGRLLPRNAGDLRDPVSAALMMILCFSAGTIAITVYGPLLMTLLHGSSALLAGYVIACSSIGWSVAAVAVSGAPARHDRALILSGMLVLLLSIAGFAHSVPHGPVWLIAVFATLEGVGFGMSWTFVLRRARALADPDDVERVAGAIPTVQRLGYALGAAYVGVVANASGMAAGISRLTADHVGSMIFLACLPLGLCGLLAGASFLRERARSAGQDPRSI